ATDLPFALQDLAEGGEALRAELLVLQADLFEGLDGSAAVVEEQLSEPPVLVSVAHSFFAAVKLVVGPVQVPVGGLHVQEEVIEAALELGSLLVQADPRD